jgi:DNA helicase II / ATP-dependent DNA helicase PcrA
VLILAGAGSGKTRTLVYRVAHLIRAAKVDAARIVAVTFTNKAAQEMRERVRDFAGDEAKRVTISTFHSLGVRILREHGRSSDLPKRFAIYSAGDQLGALRSACSEISIDDDSFDLKRVMRRISDWKTRGVDPAARHVPRSGARQPRRRLRGPCRGRVRPLRGDAARVRRRGLRRPAAAHRALLREHEDVRQALWKRWHYFMIDEYQDTNAVQLEMARLLAGPRRNLCVVGDDDQSIYAFRGADVGNILEFERHFPGASVIRLEQNYRSTQRILAAANAVIIAATGTATPSGCARQRVGAPIDLYTHETTRREAEASRARSRSGA